MGKLKKIVIGKINMENYKYLSVDGEIKFRDLVVSSLSIFAKKPK